MKKNKGVTLIALTVIIIVLMILASVGTYSGVSALKDAKEKSKISEVNMLQQVVLENYTKYLSTKKIGSEEASFNKYILGTKVSYSEVSNVIAEINNKSSENPITLKVNDYDSLDPQTTDKTIYYYRLSKENLQSMGISQGEEEYIVNYKTGEVINENLKVTRTGIPLYVYSVKAN